MSILRSVRLLASVAVSAAAMLTLAACSSGIPLIGGDDGPGGKPGAGNEHFTGPHPADFAIHGIDVSKYQGDIDWRTVKASGVKFVWIKATEGGDHVDEKFAQNWAGAAAAGIPRGAYHFVWWCRPPNEETGWFKQNVPVDPNALAPVLDVEATPTSKSCKRRLDRSVIPEIRQMLQDMERHYGKKPVIYTTVDFYESILSPNEFQDYPIWIRSTKHPPHVRYGEREWTFWQYQSDGFIPGIKGKVDRNAFHGTAKQWQLFLAGKYTAPRHQ